MKRTWQNHKSSKLGEIVKKRGFTLTQLGSLIYDKTGHYISVQNLSSYCTGFRRIGTIEMAKRIADSLEVPVSDIV